MLQEVEAIKQKVVSFNNLRVSFSSYTDQRLKFSYNIFSLINNPFLVKLGSMLTLIGLKLKLPINSIIKATIFKQFCGGENINECIKVANHLGQYHLDSILDFSAEGKQHEDDFERTKKEMLRIVDAARDHPNIPYTSIKITSIIRFGLLEKITKGDQLTTDESNEWERAKKRLDTICVACKENNVPLYVDAEETWIQKAVDDITEDMMKKYNNRDTAFVQTTLQMYRWDRIDYLKKIIENAKRGNYLIGVKLVRGAYCEKENERSKKLGYKTPIHPKKEDTDNDFNKAITICIENIEWVELCNATHNEESSMHLVELMRKHKLPNNHPHVWSSQLYGMSDNISFNLADAGYNITKYLPYGPIPSVTPYLLRRAEENTAIKGQMGRELKLILAEKKRRKGSPNSA